MKLLIIFLLTSSFFAIQHTFAQEVFSHPAKVSPSSEITIYAAADYPAMEPVIKAFQNTYPSISVNYNEFSTRHLFESFLDQHPTSPDLVLSSAMDLQIKLVNDGYAQPFISSETKSLPPWAKWRNEIFGFTYEPAVIAFNDKLFEKKPPPGSRADLLDLIRRNSATVTGRIGTFDIEKVGVGYLIWSHDSQHAGSYSGRILESFGAHEVRLFPSSSSMLKALAKEEILIAYNPLGSYAHSWAKKHPEISVIFPSDFTTVVIRSAFIPKRAKNTENAGLFLNFILSNTGQQILADQSNLYPIRENISGETTAKNLRISSASPLRPIPLGLSLLSQTDKMKRMLLFEEWEQALKEFE